MKKNWMLLTLIILSGEFTLAQSQNVFSGEKKETINMVKGDFNHDGIADEVALLEPTETGSTEISILHSTGASFIPLWSSKVEVPYNTIDGRITSGDFDQDGYVDDIAAIAEVGLCKTKILVFTGENNAFNKKEYWYGPDFDARETMQRVVSGDFDNDGFTNDLATIYNYDGVRTKIFVWKSNGTAFEWPGTWWVGPDFNALCTSFTTVSGDFDNDGFVDDIASIYNYSDKSSKIFVWKSTRSKFEWPCTYWFDEWFDVNQVKAVASGDFDLDGFADDIAALYSNGNGAVNAFVWENNTFRFAEPELFSSNVFSDKEMICIPVSGDFNANGKQAQIVMLTKDNKSLSLEMITADGSQFSLPETWWERICPSNNDCANILSVENMNLDLSAEINPNPGNGIFHLSLPINAKNTSVEVYNMAGSLILNQPVSETNFTLNLTDQPEGVYLVKLTENYKHKTMKIQISK